MSAGALAPSALQDDASDLAGTLTGHLEAFAGRLTEGARTRVNHLGRVSEDADAFEAVLVSAGWTLPELLVALAIVAGVTLAALVTTRRFGRADTSGFALAVLGATLALALGAVVVHVVTGGEPMAQRALLSFVLAVVLGGVANAIVGAVVRDRSRPGGAARKLSLHRYRTLIIAALVWALFGIAVVSALRQFGAGPGLREVVGTFGTLLPVTALLVVAYVGSRRELVLALAGPRPRTNRRVLVARLWPLLAPALIGATLALAQIAATLGQPLRPLAVFVTVVVILLGPHLDALTKAWAGAGAFTTSVPLALAAGRRTARVALVAVGAALLVAVWGAPVAIAIGAHLSALAWPAVEVAGVILVSAYLWNVVGVAVDRALLAETAVHAQVDADEGGHYTRSRLGTVLPLIGGAAKAGLAALAMLTVLLALGVNVWPLITGLSVFGLAIGFGSQTLVKDIVSGLFFLSDDAFRQGEYVETSGAKGTVEKISIRSVSLRHPRGALATIPYGQIGKIQNFSRDWVIEKLAFRVAFHTDVEQLRKIFKKIGQDLAAEPELAQDLLEPFKSQGIAAVEDGTLVVRGKFKAKAGKQFQIKKRVLAAVQNAFRENAIEAVPRPMSMAKPDA